MNIKQTDNKLINELLDDNIELIINRFKNSKSIKHNPTKGTARETIIIDVLSKIIPPHIGIGSGIAFDRAGRQSPQLDIVIYDKRVLPSILLEKDGYFPIDCIIYIIEVKSILNISELRDTIKKFEAVRKLKRIQNCEINTCLLSYDSDLKQTNELERYIREDNEYKQNPKIHNILSIKKGNIFFFKSVLANYQLENIYSKYFYGFTQITPIDTLKIFFMQIMNTLFEMNIGQYIYKNMGTNKYTLNFYDSMGVLLYGEEDITNGDIKSFEFKFDVISRKFSIYKFLEIDYLPYDI